MKKIVNQINQFFEKASKLITTKRLAVFMIAVLIVSLIPLFYISRYDVPSADDFLNAIGPYRDWNQNHSIKSLAVTSFNHSRFSYLNWQGTFTGSYLSYFTYPLLISNYWATVLFTLLPLSICSMFLLYVLFKKLFGADLWTSLLISACSTICVIQLVPSAAESYYWACGAILYTTFLALFFLLAGMTVLLFSRDDKNYRIFYVIAGSILAIICGNSNFIIGFGGLELIVLMIGLLIFSKNKNLKIISIPAFFFFVSCIFMIAAPGNGTRQGFLNNAPIPKTIARALLYGVECITGASPLLWITVIFLIPFFVKIAMKSNLAFKYPAAASVLSWLFFSSLICPCYYSEYIIGPARAQGIYSCFFVLLFILNIFHWTGWLAKKISRSLTPFSDFIKNNKSAVNLFVKTCKKHAFAAICGLAIFISAFSFSAYMDESIWNYASISAVKDLTSGVARSYFAEHQERLEMYNNPDIKDVKVKVLNTYPKTIFFNELRDIPNIWPNTCVEKFYNKNSVVLVHRDYEETNEES